MSKLITERDILIANRRNLKELVVEDSAIITPSALDAAASRQINIVREKASVSQIVSACETIVLGADHGGFEMKESIKEFLISNGYKVEDVGTYSAESVDYPDFAYAVAAKVAINRNQVGIIIDGAGIGSAMVANKVAGIRAAPCQSIYTAKNSRLHNNANVLTLGSRVLQDDEAKAIVSAWLESSFEGGRHQKRVDKIMAVETKS